MQEITYAEAGVDIRKEDMVVKAISNRLRSTFKTREGRVGEVMRDIGSFANLIDLKNDYALAMCADGVGSKVLVAQALGDYTTIGEDVVAMNVNDLICIGAEPLAMVDYLAVEKADAGDIEIIKDIASGIASGAQKADIAVIGGETATLPEILTGYRNKQERRMGLGFDLAGAAIGIVKKDKIITGEKVGVGDSIIGLKSSGIHSNGLTLARKVLPESMWYELLTPTRIYVKEVMALINNYDIHGLANITGGGFLNLKRLSNEYGFLLDNMPRVPGIFKEIQRHGVGDEEMYRTFNMGIGFCVITGKEDAEEIIEKYGSKSEMQIIGGVVREGGVRIIRDEKEILI